jgi:hypothetical protein
MAAFGDFIAKNVSIWANCERICLNLNSSELYLSEKEICNRDSRLRNLLRHTKFDVCGANLLHPQFLPQFCAVKAQSKCHRSPQSSVSSRQVTNQVFQCAFIHHTLNMVTEAKSILVKHFCQYFLSTMSL